MGEIKILYILTKSGIGGAQKYVADLANNLDAKKFEAKIIYGKKDLVWLSNKTQPWFLFINDWMAIFEIIRILKRETPDIIHLNSSKAGVIGTIATAIANSGSTKKIKVVFTAHGWVFNPTNELNVFVRYFYIFLHKLAAKFQDKIICVSEYDYNLALQYNICKPEKLVKIHNGINANIKFLSKKEARENLQFKIYNLQTTDKNDGKTIKNNQKWVGSIGRLVREKNYETFIEAAKFVPNAYFFIIGEGQELKNLQFTIYNLQLGNRFFIIPPTGNDAQFLKAFDVFVMSSIKEGLPYVLLEAMAAELPIVITEAGGMPELIKNHENGLMVAQKNPEALAHAIGGLIANPSVSKELAKKANETVVEKFSLKKMARETEEIYLMK
jgi:glycosyltransferase involved in cell wall biosynthesis